MIPSLFALPQANPKHPAKYTDALLSTFARMLSGRQRILDPFGGTGKVFLLNHWLPTAQIEAVEIEPEWAAINPRTTIGNALRLPLADNSFDAICTSPTYGNQMANVSHKENWAHSWKTFRYADMLNRNLSPDNSGRLLWGWAYRVFHEGAWAEARRVLQPDSVFVLNIKNHFLHGKEQRVTEWHIETLQSLGFELIDHTRIRCPHMRFGIGRTERVDTESVILFALKTKTEHTPCQP